MKTAVATIFLFGTFCLLFVVGWRLGRVTAIAEPSSVTDTVTDTLVDWRYDTLFRYDTKYVMLPVHDTTTLTDSLLMIDSVLVEVPIYKYVYDTILRDTHSTTRLHAILSGYSLNVDTLALTSTVSPVIIRETIPWRKRFRPSIGIGIGSNLKGEASVGAYFGIGYLF